jgi:uncharacterized hydrophobic protein (TIGR00271 family)
MSAQTTGTGSTGALARARRFLATWANPATTRGALGVVGGMLVLLFPVIGEAAVGPLIALALVASAAINLGYAFARRGPRRTGRRIGAALRGLAALATATVLFLSPHFGPPLVVLTIGFYLVARGLVQLATAAFVRADRRASVTGGATAVGLGLVAIVSPSGLQSGLIATGALAAVVVGALVLVHGIRRARAATGEGAVADELSVAEILQAWISEADLGPLRREEVAATLYFEQPERTAKQVAWWVMLVLSVAIATFAVLQDSTAVVIGAMLVAPLMTPILGLSAALVNGWRRRSGRSLLQVALGVTASVVIAFALSSWLPVVGSFTTNSQITSRVSPTFLDMLIAVAAGAAGAFATIDRRVSQSIAGVAIAVALVPPLSVVGISLGAGRLGDAAGAGLLFATNFVAIVLSSAVVFLLGGFVGPAVVRGIGVRRLLQTLAPFLAAALFVMVPLLFTSQGLLVASERHRTAQETVVQWLPEEGALVLQSVTVTAPRGTGTTVVDVAVAGPRDMPDAEALRDRLSEALGTDVTLRITRTPAFVTEVDPQP